MVAIDVMFKLVSTCKTNIKAFDMIFEIGLRVVVRTWILWKYFTTSCINKYITITY